MELFNVFVNLKQVDLQMNRITTLSGRLVLRSFEILPLFTNQLGHIDLCGWDVPSVKKMFFTVNFLTTLPKCINNWTSVSHLDLSYNEFTNFSIESVAGMNNLESIDLECNKLTEIMLNSVHFPPKLKEIRISRNYLTSLDLSFIPVRSLQVSVEYNLISIPRDIKNAPMLSNLRLQESKISEIDLAAFCDHSNLSEIFLDGNKIRYVVNTSKRNCSIYGSLTGIQLSDNLLTTVNMELFNVFVSLRQLDIQMNRITTLSGRLAHRSLEHLDLSILEQLPTFIVELSIHSSDRLKRISVPKAINVIHIIESGLRRIDIFEGSSLTKLNVYDCDMTRLPRSIRNAPNLKNFRIDKCKLSNIDLATFCDYPYLRDLRLNGNKIRYVVNTSKRNCSIYSSVTLLELGNNMLTTVNMELFNAFTKLKALSLYNNKIVSITGQLALDSLSNLLMGGNRLEHLDLCGWYVPSMESVLLSLNRFTKIPECLNHWKSVSSLMLNHNQFTSFSIDKLAGMSNLTNLYLQCNKLTE
ncbi:AGAP011649-PA, partial [Anopheles gambiae str. PEST]